MPISIPYNHPSLVLGNVADTRVLEKISQMRELQNQTDAAQEQLNSLIQMKRSISMTINELKGMRINLQAVEQKSKDIDASISAVAEKYLTTFLANEGGIAQLKQELFEIPCDKMPESPIDFTVSRLIPEPFSTGSLKLDSQYFSMGSNLQDDTIANIEMFVRDATGGDALARTASTQVANQSRNHHLCGTLVIVASCTHRNIEVFSPLVIDPDKAIRAWNLLFPAAEHILSPESEPLSRMEGGSPDEKVLTLITGAACGSSFVGMVHMLQAETAQTGNMDRLREQLEEKLQIGGWLSNATGNIGIDPVMLNEVKAFLSTQSISTHISVATMGVVPSIKSNSLKMGVKQCSDVSQSVLANAFNAPAGTTSTVASKSQNATGLRQNVMVQNMRAEKLLSTMAEIDHKSNNVMDINSLMLALDNYLNVVSDPAKSSGAPISFYTRRLTRNDILRLWFEKYNPDKKEPGAKAE